MANDKINVVGTNIAEKATLKIIVEALEKACDNHFERITE